jgi:hypothetical protein
MVRVNHEAQALTGFLKQIPGEYKVHDKDQARSSAGKR